MPRGGRRDGDAPGQYPPLLVGDSDGGSRRVFRLLFERQGFQVLEAAAGEEALALAEAYPPCVVIAESTLPRDDEFQAYVRTNRIPCIATITNAEGTVPPQAVAVLEKPFALSELLREVFRVLRRDSEPRPA